MRKNQEKFETKKKEEFNKKIENEKNGKILLFRGKYIDHSKKFFFHSLKFRKRERE